MYQVIGKMMIMMIMMMMMINLMIMIKMMMVMMKTPCFFVILSHKKAHC